MRTKLPQKAYLQVFLTSAEVAKRAGAPFCRDRRGGRFGKSGLRCERSRIERGINGCLHDGGLRRITDPGLRRSTYEGDRTGRRSQRKNLFAGGNTEAGGAVVVNELDGHSSDLAFGVRREGTPSPCWSHSSDLFRTLATRSTNGCRSSSADPCKARPNAHRDSVVGGKATNGRPQRFSP